MDFLSCKSKLFPLSMNPGLLPLWAYMLLKGPPREATKPEAVMAAASEEVEGEGEGSSPLLPLRICTFLTAKWRTEKNIFCFSW